MFLAFDTETTGKVDFKVAVDAPTQPRIVQLGAILFDDAERVMAEINFLVKPNGWTIPAEASAVHGITTEMCEQYGFPIQSVLKIFMALVRKSKEVAAHNFVFDQQMVWHELLDLKAADDLAYFLSVPSFCTMERSTNVIKLPGRYDDYKWPNLQEAHEFFLGHKFEGGHDAMIDVRACSRVYFAMKRYAVALSPAPASASKIIDAE